MNAVLSNRGAVRVWLRSIPWWGQCLLLWLAVVVGLSMAGLVGVRVLDLREGYDPIIGVPPESLPGIWARWDSPYYVNIAQNGYAAIPYAMGYFPLYPLSLAGLSQLTGWDPVTSGVVIAQLSYLAAMLIFYKLARLVRDEHGFAMRSVVAMAVFPTSFFFLAMYAESLALALGLLSVYLTLRGRWAWSGLALGLAAAARPVGWILIIVLLAEFVRRRQFDRRSLASLFAGLILSVSGVVIYVLYLYSLTGTFFAITQAQSLWLRTWALPWETLFKGIALAFTGNQVEGDWFLYVSNLSDLSFTLLAIGLTILSFRRLPRSLFLYLAASVVFLLMTQGLPEVPLWGMARWVGAVFPLYLVIAGLTENKIVLRLSTALSALLMLGFMAWWASGRWVG
jgi:Gpi18-like mannosyltransferase